MTCIHLQVHSTKGFGTGYTCAMTGEEYPDCENCDDCQEDPNAA